MQSNPRVGEYIKVHIPGESLWVICTERPHANALTGKIDNHPENSDAHGLNYGDTAQFFRYADSDWELVITEKPQ
jgi:hypothetical protein